MILVSCHYHPLFGIKLHLVRLKPLSFCLKIVLRQTASSFHIENPESLAMHKARDEARIAQPINRSGSIRPNAIRPQFLHPFARPTQQLVTLVGTGGEQQVAFLIGNQIPNGFLMQIALVVRRQPADQLSCGPFPYYSLSTCRENQIASVGHCVYWP